ncbi:MAG TPA: hypothetical protein VF599_00350 [Pyrinomonadaceae bacterium]|jgi:hypothetical protein
MKKFVFVKLSVLIFISILFHGCGRFNKSTEADGRFPALIGNFRRDIVYNEREHIYLNEKNKNQKYKSSDAKYSEGSDEVFYGISNHQTAEDAINELPKEASHGNNTVWKTADLKDKSGKSVGKITICRINDSSPNSPNAANGGFNYSVAFNIGNQNHHAYLSTTNLWTPQKTDNFVAFVKTLPAASQVDMSLLDMITTSFAGKGVTVEKISAISPPVKTASAPYLKGKTTVVVSGTTYSDGVKTEEYIQDSEQQANLMEEVGSIVKVECTKGSLIGQYLVKEKNIKIPAYSSVCKAMIIDNSIPAVIAQKSFTNSLLMDNTTVNVDKDGKLKDYDKEYVASFPTNDVAQFLQKLPKK